MASPAGTPSSCRTQRGHWNGKEGDAVPSGCRRLTPRTSAGRASSGSTCRSGGSTDHRRHAEGGAKSTPRNEKPNRETNESSRMRVGVRVRPAFSSEVLSGYRPAVAVSKDSVQPELSRVGRECLGEEDGLIGNRFEQGTKATLQKQAETVELRMSNWRYRRFSFDYAFDASCQQDEIYQSIAAPVVEGCLIGRHGLIMAYGQTASGKSHTMGILKGIEVSAVDPGSFGSQNPSLSQDTRKSTAERRLRGANLDTETFVQVYGKPTSVECKSHNQVDPGVIPRALSRVFDHERQSIDASIKVKVSLLQIHNETVQDLLSPAAPFGGEGMGLNIREDPSIGFFVEGLWEHDVRSHQEAATLINSGLQKRTTARTAKNDISSRSHTVLTITLEQGNGLELFQSASQEDAVATAKRHVGGKGKSKLVLVDLAGSERGRKSYAYAQGESETERLREAGYINQSLSALGNVVAALGKEEVDRPHIPFRDSKLTRILADTLGGNANAALIATVGPAPQNQAESLSTLVFASRCMRVQSRLEARVESVEIETTLRLQAQLSSMQREFCRREALQQSRYETVVTRLAQELEYARNSASSARASRRSVDTKRRPPSSSFTMGDLPSADTSCHASALLYAEENMTSNSPKRCTGTAIAKATAAATSSSFYGQTDAMKQRCNCSNKTMGEIAAPAGTSIPETTETMKESASKAQGHELVAWEMLGAAVRTLEVVGYVGAEVVRQARRVGRAGDVARDETTLEQPRRPGPLGEATNLAEAMLQTNEDNSRLKRSNISQRLGDLRKLCEGQWMEAGAIFSSIKRDKSSAQQMLRTEAMERHRQETKARRLSCALRHLLDDGESPNRDGLTPTPHRVPEERRGPEAERGSPYCSSDASATDQEDRCGSHIGCEAATLFGTGEKAYSGNADDRGRSHSAAATSCGNGGSRTHSESADWASSAEHEGSGFVADPAVFENQRKF